MAGEDEPATGTTAGASRETPEAEARTSGALRSLRGSVAATLVVLALIVGVLWWWGRPGAGGPGSTGHGGRVGSLAPDFSLPRVGDPGDPISLSGFRGYVLVLNFWASWCGPCRAEAPGLRDAAVAYREAGVRFLGVDERDNDASATAFQDEFSIPYPSAFDPSGSLGDDYGLLGLPDTFVLDRDGIIIARFSGYLDAATLRSALDHATAPVG